MERLCARLTQFQSQVKRPEHQTRSHVIANRPTHDSTREEVKDNGQVEPALPSPHIGDVSSPRLIRS